MKVKGTYSPEWPEISRLVKEAADWKCVRCGHPHDSQSGYVLTVHHFDGDKTNNAWWNLAALCQRCHLTIQAKVKIEQIYMLPHSNWFKPYVAGYYAFLMGRPTSKEYVIPRCDELIAAYLERSV